MEQARAGLATQLEAFAANTMEYLLEERAPAARRCRLPRDPHLVRGPARAHRRARLRLPRGPAGAAALRPRVPARPDRRRRRGRRAVRGRATRPTSSSATWTRSPTRRCAAAPRWSCTPPPTGDAPGLQRVQDLGVHAVLFPAAGTSEDVAMLLADEAGASLHRRRRHARDAGRVPRRGPRRGWRPPSSPGCAWAASSSTPRAFSRLYRTRISSWSLLALVLSTLLAMAAALYVTSVADAYQDVLAEVWASVWSTAGDLR